MSPLNKGGLHKQQHLVSAQSPLDIYLYGWLSTLCLARS